MLRGFIIICAIWLASAGSTVAAVNEDVRCVQAFLATTAFDPGPIDGALGKKTVKAAADFSVRAAVSEQLPILSVETAGQWCQYAQSGDAITAAVVASLMLYPVSITSLSELDDGTGLIPFDFRSVAVTSRYDQTACKFVLNRIFGEEHQRIAEGELAITNGQIQFTKAAWLTGGLSTPEAFQRANLALTEEGKIVGKLPVFSIFINPGDVPQRAFIASLGKSDDRFEGSDPTGAVGFELNGDMSGELMIRTCRDADGKYAKYAYDFSPHELSNAFDGKACKLEIRRRLDDDSVQVIGTAEAAIANGRLTLSNGVWRTGGGAESFDVANLSITASGQMVGVWEVYPTFPDKQSPVSIANTVEMAPSDGSLGDDLSKTVTFAFPLERFMTGELSFRTCKDESGKYAKYAYDFADYELNTAHDGKECLLEVSRRLVQEDRVQIIGSATATIKDGHFSLSNGKWRTEGPPDSFEFANLALTSKGKIVGTWEVYPQFPDTENPQTFSRNIEMAKSKGNLDDNLSGTVSFPIPGDERFATGELSIKTCKDADGNYVKYAYDFSRFDLTSDFDGMRCRVRISRMLTNEGNIIQDIGAGLATVDGGLLTFKSGAWTTGGPMTSFFLANLGITEDRRLVGVWDFYPGSPPQSNTVLMDKTKDRLGENLTETVTFRLPEERFMIGRVALQCEKPA